MGPELLFPENITLAVKSHFHLHSFKLGYWLWDTWEPMLLVSLMLNQASVSVWKPEWDFRDTMEGNMLSVNHWVTYEEILGNTLV